MADGRIAVNWGAGVAKVGLTIAKLVEARRQLRTLGADMLGLTLAVAPTQEADIIHQLHVAKTNFLDSPQVKDGVVLRFFGFDVEVRLDLPMVDGVRECLAFAKSKYEAGTIVPGPSIVIQSAEYG